MCGLSRGLSRCPAVHSSYKASALSSQARIIEHVQVVEGHERRRGSGPRSFSLPCNAGSYKASVSLVITEEVF